MGPRGWIVSIDFVNDTYFDHCRRQVMCTQYPVLSGRMQTFFRKAGLVVVEDENMAMRDTFVTHLSKELTTATKQWATPYSDGMISESKWRNSCQPLQRKVLQVIEAVANRRHPHGHWDSGSDSFVRSFGLWCGQ